MKKFIPPSFRLRLRVLYTLAVDIFTLQYFSFSKKNKTISLPHQLSKSQPIRKNKYSENKKENLCLAIRHIDNVVIQPSQIFSYWHLIPQPIPQNGFKKGRNLVGNTLALDYGGGLCQLSGIIYHLVMEAGLEILERHPHSLDIYTETSRYTPLGSDATVVYGHKDLRFRNNLGFPICLQFEVLEDKINAYLNAQNTIEPYHIEFMVSILNNGKQVQVKRLLKDTEDLMSNDFYKNL